MGAEKFGVESVRIHRCLAFFVYLNGTGGVVLHVRYEYLEVSCRAGIWIGRRSCERLMGVCTVYSLHVFESSIQENITRCLHMASVTQVRSSGQFRERSALHWRLLFL